MAGIIARLTLGRERGRARTKEEILSAKSRFWDARPFTRIVAWGRDYLGVRKYLALSVLEAVGFLPLRKKLYRELCSTA